MKLTFGFICLFKISPGHLTCQCVGNYFRLRELQGGLGKTAVGPEDSIGPDSMLTPDKDPDSLSLCSTGSTLSLSQSGKTNYDLVELNVHGITEAGM